MAATQVDRVTGDGAPGPVLFARYAYPPNERGYCGPDDSVALLEYGAAGAVDPGLALLASRFQGAWPYLELIAAVTGIGDPLDRRVVEAYWVGNDLLSGIDMAAFGASVGDRFRPRAGTGWEHLAEAIPAGGRPHHAFHVFAVYPWVGLLGPDRGEHPLHVLDRCRIRWGRVIQVGADDAVVESEPLTWDGRRLALGPPRPERATRAVAGTGFVRDLVPGDWVALHWDWICDRLTRRQLAALRHWQRWQLDISNERLSHPGPAMALS